MATKEITIKFSDVKILPIPKAKLGYFYRLIGFSGGNRVDIESLQTFDTKADAFACCKRDYPDVFMEREWSYQADNNSIQ